jgi:hypothetical protein
MLFAGMPGGPGMFDDLERGMIALLAFFSLTVLLLATALAWWFCYFEDVVRRRLEQAALNPATAGRKTNASRQTG